MKQLIFFTNSSKGQKYHQLDTQLGNSTNLFLVKSAFDLMKNYVIVQSVSVCCGN